MTHLALTNEIKKKNNPVHFNNSVNTLNTPIGDLYQLAASNPRVGTGAHKELHALEVPAVEPSGTAGRGSFGSR